MGCPRALILPFAIALSLFSMTSARAQTYSYGVIEEAVDHYGNQPGFGDIACIGEADSFYNTLVYAGGTIFTAGSRWTDDNVWDTDFTDPDFTHNWFDADTYNFDQSSAAIAYVCGHGQCDDEDTTWCSSSSQCNAPPAWGANPGVCVGWGPPYGYYGNCYYTVPRKIVINNYANNHYGGKIDYSTGNRVKFGESSYSTGWAGAGTNGNLNFAVISNSCGMRPGNFIWNYSHGLFAGLTLLGILMPTTYGSDTVDAVSRGTYTAGGYVANPSSSVGLDFVNAISSVPQNDGGGCPQGSGTDYSYGGGHGIDGCGAHVAISVDQDYYHADYNVVTRNWPQYTVNVLDSTSQGYWRAQWVCNYDCNTYPLSY